jgi:glycerophosphoryl diester phosphodiesterase
MKDLTWLTTEYIAHRGLHQKDQSVPENSMESFRLALLNDCAIELDVNLSKDEVPIVFHDHNLKRMTGIDQLVTDLNLSELKEISLANTTENIPTLSEVLSLVDQKKPLLIELKPYHNVDMLTYKVMELLNDYQGEYAIFSFHPTAVSLLKKFYPHVIRGQISEYFKDNKHMNKFQKYLMKSMYFNRATQPDFVSYGINDLPNKYLDKLKKKGVVIISYAARSQEDFDKVKSYYDNVVFEYFMPKR